MTDPALTELLPLGPDDTPYRLLTTDGVATIEAAGRTFLEVDPDALTLLARTAFHDIAPWLRPAPLEQLPRILDDMKQVFDRGEEYGRFIHGSFGSGKSHFMTMLSLLLEGTPAAWKKFRPLLGVPRDSHASKGRESTDHEVWLGKAGLLVVRIHMLSVRGRSTGFDRAVYEGFNAALKRRGRVLEHDLAALRAEWTALINAGASARRAIS